MTSVHSVEEENFIEALAKSYNGQEQTFWMGAKPTGDSAVQLHLGKPKKGLFVIHVRKVMPPPPPPGTIKKKCFKIRQFICI